MKSKGESKYLDLSIENGDDVPGEPVYTLLLSCTSKQNLRILY